MSHNLPILIFRKHIPIHPSNDLIIHFLQTLFLTTTFVKVIHLMSQCNPDMDTIVDQDDIPSQPPPNNMASSSSCSDSDASDGNQKKKDSDYESLPPIDDHPSSSTDSDMSTTPPPDSSNIQPSHNEDQ